MYVGKRGLWILVLVFAVGVLSLSVQAVNGCFTEPSFVVLNDGCAYISDATARTDSRYCADAQNVQQCVTNYFLEGAACNQVPLCQRNSGTWCADTCQQVEFQAACTDRNQWIPPPADGSSPPIPSQCEEGCCVCSSSSGSVCPGNDYYQKTRNQCELACASLGGIGYFNKDPSFQKTQCTPLCGNLQNTQGNIEGLVESGNGDPIAGAVVRTYSTSSVTDAQGHYQLENLPEGHTTIRVSHPIYITQQVDVQLSSGEQKRVDIVLSFANTGVIRGTVKNDAGVPLAGARVAVVGAPLQSVTTNLGEFEITGVPYGTITVEASALHFQSLRKSVSVASGTPLVVITFDLVPESAGTITGTVKDKTTGNTLPDARIYIDNPFVPVGLTGFNGLFSIIKPASLIGIPYQVYAEHLDYVKSAAVPVTLTTGSSANVNFELVPKGRECDYPAADRVTLFTADHVLGEKKVMLRWERPCIGVSGYILNKSLLVQGFARTQSQQVAFVDDVAGYLTYEDEAVDWSASYEYDIIAVYADGAIRTSNRTTVGIMMGDEQCSRKFIGNTPSEFCDGTRRKACTAENKINEIADCSSASTFCAGPINGVTYCEDTSVCSSESLGANPFGLWFTQNACYGTYNTALQRYPNFCAFDRTRTIFDACVPCNSITSCFDYKGPEACLTNNCYAGDCAWVDAAAELGTGYCVDTNAREKFGTAQCSQCGTSASLFTSALCTGEICSALGACYANEAQTLCTGCEATSSCYDFKSEAECVDSGVSAHFTNGALAPSQDVCNLGRCRWDNQHDICFKDGDGNSQDDCAGAGAACRQDNKAPVTSITPEVIRANDLSNTILFHIDGGSGKLFYCIDKADSCIPRDFSLYRSDGTLSLSFDTAGLGKIYDGSETYFLRYYSEDTAFNRENVQSKRFGADLDDPLITIQHTVDLNATGSEVTFTLTLDKPAACSDSLMRSGSIPLSKISNNRTLSRLVTYENLPDGLYVYKVDCTDYFGNTAHQLLSSIEVYAEGFIRVLMPPRALKTSSFSFEVNTSSPALCELSDDSLLTREPLAASRDNLNHKSTVKSFSPNTYYSNWRVVCTEANGRDHERHILFSIDRQPPSTTLVVASSEGIVTIYGTVGFRALAENKSFISLNCKDNPLDAGQEVGFLCSQSFFCFNETGECSPRPFTSQAPLHKDGTICFYSSDRGGNNETAKCGTVEISSRFGITVTEPTFGVSNIPHYDLEIYTAVPSVECKWAGFSGAPFNFEQLITSVNNFTLVSPHIFRIGNFSSLLSHLKDGELELIDIRCRAVSGRISPSDVFEIGYDTTVPIIQIHRAEPSFVTQGNSIDFVVVTNEPTLCKYGRGSAYDQLTTGFPGFVEEEFAREHRVRKPLVASDDKKLHAYNVSCMNRAENISLMAPITFEVDFSVAGAIAEALPTGAIASTNATLTIRTSKNAFCTYADNTSTSNVLSSSNGILHEKKVGNLQQGSHSYPVQCRFSQPIVNRDATISFIVDTTPPIVHSVEDGNYSCGMVVRPTVTATDNHSSVVGYEYTLLQDSSTVAQGNFSSPNSELRGLNLTLGSIYFFKIKAVDAAGNRGAETSSNGFTVVASNATECQENDPPALSIASTITRNGASVALSCSDETGCVVTRYGIAENRSSCSADTSYSVPIVVREDSTFCAYAEDGAGNSAYDDKFVSIPDEDADGVPDEFDKCPETPAGDSADVDGCAYSQLHIDTDGDGLDDDWELQYDAADCPLDPHEIDSDMDGVEDGDEDYDMDRVLNIDEFRSNSDPCRRTAPSETGRPGSDVPGQGEDSSLLAVMLLLFGMFFLLLGISYLTYIAFYRPRESMGVGMPSSVPRALQRPLSQARPAPARPQSSVVLQKREARRYGEVARRRKVLSAFSAFGTPDEKSAKARPAQPAPVSSSSELKKTAFEPHSQEKKEPVGVTEASAFERLDKLTHHGSGDQETDAVLNRLSQVINKHNRAKKK